EFLDDPIGILRTDPGCDAPGVQFPGTPGDHVVAEVVQIVEDGLEDLPKRRADLAERPEVQHAVLEEDLGRAHRAADQARERRRILLDVRGPVGAGQLLDDVADGLDVVDDVRPEPAPAVADPEVALLLSRANLGPHARLWARL